MGQLVPQVALLIPVSRHIIAYILIRLRIKFEERYAHLPALCVLAHPPAVVLLILLAYVTHEVYFSNGSFIGIAGAGSPFGS